MGMSCLDCHDFMDGYNRGKKEGVIEELEKIKAEFEDRILLNQTVAIQIIEKHISELKGEQE